MTRLNYHVRKSFLINTIKEVSFMISMSKTQESNRPGKKALMFVISEASLFPKMEGRN